MAKKKQNQDGPLLPFGSKGPVIPLEDLVREEYRQYQIYTLMDRAIPYLQDGLKPCQRRILFTLWKNQNKGLLKVSAATGLVLTLHPHGPPSIESSIVNLAQDFTFANNYPLIDKKGYFGERMEQSPAAGRYIECKLGKMAELLLFDDMEQVEMIPNYDERTTEPVAFLPKLPLMLLNGSEGIGTGFSSVIPSFHHRDVVDSMIHVISHGKPKRLRPYFAHYKGDVIIDEKDRILTSMRIEEIGDKIFITELPRGYDGERIYRYLMKFIDNDYLKDYIDSSVDNEIKIELIFKKGQRPSLNEVREAMKVTTSITPNYTLISERGVRILDSAEEIIDIFTKQRLAVVKRRYEIWFDDCQKRIVQNQEIIRFIEEKHYEKARKLANRKSFVEYLNSQKFTHSEYLADMAIYRLTTEEMGKRQSMIKDDEKKSKEYRQIARSEALIKEKLIEELILVRDKLTEITKQRDKEKMKVFEKRSSS